MSTKSKKSSSKQTKTIVNETSKSELPPPKPVETPSNVPTSFDSFNVKEDSNFSQMKNNIITQSTRICEIISDASKFSTFYNDLTNNIVGSMNDMIRMYVKAGKRAILVDVYDALIDSTDWDSLKTRFKTDVVSAGPLALPKWNSISTDLKRFKIDVYDTDILVDMYSNMDESTVKHFAKSQEDANNKLYELIDDVGAFESALCNYRTKTIEIMKQNIEVLYALHVNYAKAVVAKEQKIPDQITINGKVIKFQTGQKPFITEALKKIILE